MKSLNLSDSQMARQILMMFTADKKQTAAGIRLFGAFSFLPLARTGNSQLQLYFDGAVNCGKICICWQEGRAK